MVLQKEFKGTEVDFEPFIKNKNVMVNATQMGNIYGKKVEAFTRNESTQKFIKECLKSENSRFLFIKNESDLINSKQKSGTWMHRILALKFAAWLDPEFELWVYQTIDDIIFGSLNETESAIEQTVQIQTKMNAIITKANKTSQDFTDYLDLSKQLKYWRSVRTRITKRRFAQVYDLFNQPGNAKDN